MLENQLKMLRDKLIEAENRIGLLATENERLNFVIKDKTRELEVLGSEIQRLDRNKSDEIENLRYKLENQTKRTMVKPFL
jgi:hypothetical protein